MWLLTVEAGDWHGALIVLACLFSSTHEDSLNKKSKKTVERNHKEAWIAWVRGRSPDLLASLGRTDGREQQARPGCQPWLSPCGPGSRRMVALWT